MTKILFICHGNICRSPMAEFVFKKMVSDMGRSQEFFAASAATSYEEIGNPVHHGTAGILKNLGISFGDKRAVHLEKTDYEKYDYLICMDSANVRNTLRIIGNDSQNKVYKLLEFAGVNRDVADPWYTDNFDATYNDVLMGCKALIEHIDNRAGF